MLTNMIKGIGGFLQAIMLLFMPFDGRPVLQLNDDYILRYYVSVMRVATSTMREVFDLLRPKDSRTIKQLLIDTGKYDTNLRLLDTGSNNTTFSDLDLQIIAACTKPTNDFDITLMNKLFLLLHRVCGLDKINKRKWYQSGTIENYLNQIRIHRNVLAHSNLDKLSTDQFKERINELEEICKEVLTLCGKEKKTDITKEVEQIKKDMEDVRQGNFKLFQTYQDELKALRSKQTSVLLREGRKDVTSLGEKLRTLNPFSWLFDGNYQHLDVEQIFTKLAIHGIRDIHMEELLTTTLLSGELPNIIIVSGGPGMGKTSLSKFIVYDWLNFKFTMHGLETVDLLLSVELRHVTSKTFEDLVSKEIIPSMIQHLHIDDAITALNNISILWLLDGYDEASPDTKKTLQDLLKKSPNSRVIITTRTEFKPEIESHVNNIHRTRISVEIKGFSEEDIGTCATKLINIHTTNIDESSDILQKFMEFCKERNDLLQQIFSVPLFLTITVIIWLKDPHNLAKIKTMSALYDALVNHIINKMISREQFDQLKRRRKILIKKINIFLDELGFILWKGELEFTLQEYEVDHLEKKCKELGIPFKETMSAFFVYNEKASEEGIREEYTIIHRTMKDFLSARAFCNNMISEKWDVMETAAKWIKTIREELQYEERPSLFKRCNLQNIEMKKPQYDISADSRKFLEYRWKKYSIRDILDILDDLDANYSNSNEHNHDDEDITRVNNFWYHIKQNLPFEFVVYCIGYLSLKKEMNEERAEQLVFVSHSKESLRLSCYDLYFILFREGNESLFSNMLQKNLQDILWLISSSFTELNEFEYAKQLLEHAVPKDIYIKVDDTTDISLENIIQPFKSQPLTIHIDLSDYDTYIDNALLDINDTLKVLLDDESTKAKLVSLHIPLAGVGIQLLEKAIHLQEISVKVTQWRLLPRFKEVIGKLPNLQKLCIVIHSKEAHDHECPPLNINHVEITDFKLIFHNPYHLGHERVVEIIGNISPHINHIVLLDYEEATKKHVYQCVDKITSEFPHIKNIEIAFRRNIFATEYKLLNTFSELLQHLKPLTDNFPKVTLTPCCNI